MRYHQIRYRVLGKWKIEALIIELPDGMLIDRHVRLSHNGSVVQRSSSYATDRTLLQNFVKLEHRIKQLITDEKEDRK